MPEVSTQRLADYHSWYHLCLEYYAAVFRYFFILVLMVVLGAGWVAITAITLQGPQALVIPVLFSAMSVLLLFFFNINFFFVIL